MFSKTLKYNFKKLLIIIAGMLLLATPLVWMQIHYPHQAYSINLIFSQYSHFFTLFRWLLISLFILFWPVFIAYMAKKQHWDSDKTSFWLSRRYQIAGWLILFELLVCENILLHLIKAF